MVKVLATLAGIGYGHITRAESLINELKKKVDCDIEIMAYGPAVKYFSSKYKVHSLIPHKYVGEMTLSFLGTLKANWKFPSTFKKNSEIIARRIKSFDPDLIISDGEFGANSIYEDLKRNGTKLVSLHNLDISLFEKYADDHKLDIKLKAELYSVRRLYNWLISSSDLVIVPTFSNNRSPIKKVKNVGLMIRKWPDELPSKYDIMINENIPLRNALVQIGGTKIGEVFVKMVNDIAEDFGEFNFTSFSSKLGVEKSNFKYVNFKKDIYKYIKASEFAISLAGHSFLSEAMAFNLPTMVVPIREHLEQLVNSWYLNKRGLVYEYSPDKQLNKSVLTEELKIFTSKLPQFKRKLAGTKFDDGAPRAVKEILKMM